jgi:hypothetical protein
MTHEGFIEHLNKEAAKHGSWKKLATFVGYSPQYLCDLKEGRRMPGDDFLDALGLEAVVDYRRKTVA